MAVDFARLKLDIIEASVRAVNGVLYVGEERAKRDVPVRKVFRGGKQTVRFKTAEEIEHDRPLRARLGLAPEILATPQAVERVRAAGRNPRKSLITTGGEFGFARTIEHPSRSRSVDRSGRTPAQRGRTEIRRDRANDFFPGGEVPSRRVLQSGELGNPGSRRLAQEPVERLLTGRGRYELRSGRAVHQRQREISYADINARTGETKEVHYARVPEGPAYLGGGLRNTIHIVKARADMFPVIEGWLVAGDSEHDYAIHQELGNRHNPAHPFLRPRLAEWREELPAALRRSLRRTGR